MESFSYIVVSSETYIKLPFIPCSVIKINIKQKIAKDHILLFSYMDCKTGSSEESKKTVNEWILKTA